MTNKFSIKLIQYFQDNITITIRKQLLCFLLGKSYHLSGNHIQQLQINKVQRTMNDLNLKPNELDNQIDQAKETIQFIELLSINNNDVLNNNEQLKQRDLVENKIIFRNMLAKKINGSYTSQIKELLHQLGIEKLSNVNLKDFEVLFLQCRSDWTMRSSIHYVLLSASSAARWISAPLLLQLKQYQQVKNYVPDATIRTWPINVNKLMHRINTELKRKTKLYWSRYYSLWPLVLISGLQYHTPNLFWLPP